MPVSKTSRYANQPLLRTGDRVTLPSRRPLTRATTTVAHRLIGPQPLDALARELYGREDLWWRVADANGSRFPLDWQPGEQLLVPAERSITRTKR